MCQPTKGRGGKWLIGQGGHGPVEVVISLLPWGGSSLHCQQSSPLAKHQTWISSSGLIQKKLRLHRSASFPKAAGGNWQEATRTPPEIFWYVSLYGVMTNRAQLHYARWTNTCVLLAKNPSLHVLPHVCFSKTSFYLCLLQQNVL